LSYNYDKKRYGIPFNQEEEEPEIVFLNPRRHSLHFTGGVREIGSFIDKAEFSLQYNDYQHQEKDALTGDVGTSFRNRTFTYRTLFDERARGRFSGSFGFSGFFRDYISIGEEALAPATTANNFAIFGLQKIDFEHALLQFGGRFEHTSYDTNPLEDRLVRDRKFNGASASVGLRVPLWQGGAFVANYTHSYRAPALEELYNFGPHPGNATFEIGNTEIKREKGDGIELSLRQSSSRARAEVSVFYYSLKDFVFLAPTGDIEDDLIVAIYTQGDTRYAGTEAKLEVGLLRNLWLNTGLDYVNAKLTDTDTPLPRIPPLRGRIGLEANYKGFRFVPEVIMAKDQDRIFPTETRTAGYTIVNLLASYTFAQQHTAHVISVNAFNVGDRLYRNHLSFIKDFAPEIGRGVRLTYTLRFF
jgi:iron complex outermembrane recepter protein